MSIAVLVREKSSQQSIRSHVLSAGWVISLGLASGFACVAVRLIFRMLQWVFVQHFGLLPEAAAALPYTRRSLTPLVGALCATAVLWAVRRWSQSERSEEYVEAVRFHHGHISFASTLWRTISSAFSVATGAAIGREGSMIQFAAAVSSWIGRRSPISRMPLARQVACGVAAAVAAAYQAPIAGMLFAMEIVIGQWRWTYVPELLIASATGWLVSITVLGPGPLFSIQGISGSRHALLWGLIVAAFAGLVAPLYHWLLRSLRFTSRWPLALAWSGLAVGLMSLWRPEVWGNGDMALMEILGGNPVLSTVVWVFAVRLVATTFCVGTGTVGGVFTPTLFVGATLGLVAGNLLHLPVPVLLALIGMGSFLAAVTHAPLMAAFMVVELTGEWHLLPVLLLYTLLARQIAHRLSQHSLYAIATPEPADEFDDNDKVSSAEKLQPFVSIKVAGHR